MSSNIKVSENHQWTNEHNCVHQRVLHRYQISNNSGTQWRDGLSGIQQMIAEARSRGERLRSYGGKWSLSDVAITPDSIHDTKPLTFWGTIPSRFIDGSPIYSDPQPLEKRLLFFQSGAQISQINRVLEDRGLCFATTGASNGQTLAGAVSTGTHGSALSIGAMQDYVRALHIVTAEDKHILLQPDTGNGAANSSGFGHVVNQDFADLLGAELVNDDELFYNALVSFGSFGVIHAMVVEVVSLYQLEMHTKFVDLAQADDVFPSLAGFDHGSNTNLTSFLQTVGMPSDEDPYHFEIVINPYEDTDNAYLRVMYKRPHDPSKLDVVDDTSRTRIGDDIISLIGGLANLIGGTVPHIASLLFGQVGDTLNGFTQTHRNIFGDSTIFKPANGIASSELGISVSDVSTAVDILQQKAREENYPGLIALRFVKPSVASLAFTRFSPLTCAIELPGLNSDNTHRYYDAVFSALDAAGIAFTLHWGQMGDYSATRLSKMYGSNVQSWLDARTRFLPDPIQRYMFTNDFMRRSGLSEPNPLDGGGPIA